MHPCRCNANYYQYVAKRLMAYIFGNYEGH